MLENRQRCIVSMSTEHTKLCLELAISGFLKWVNHWKDILRLESAAPSHECHYKYLPHIESLLRSQTSSGWYISGRHTLVVGPAAVYLWRFLWWMSAFYPLVCFVKYSNNQEDEKGNVFKIIYPFTQHRAAELKIPWKMRNSQKKGAEQRPHHNQHLPSHLHSPQLQSWGVHRLQLLRQLPVAGPAHVNGHRTRCCSISPQ